MPCVTTRDPCATAMDFDPGDFKTSLFIVAETKSDEMGVNVNVKTIIP